MGKFKMKKPTFGKSPNQMKSPLPQQALETAGDIVTNIPKTGGTFGRVLPAVSIPYSLYNMYTSGQEHSGGRTGYEKNPNWDGVTRSGNARFGGSEGHVNKNGEFVRDDGTAQFRRSYTENAINEIERNWKNKQSMEESKQKRESKETKRKAKNQLATDKMQHEAIDHKQRNNPDYGPHKNKFHDYPGSNAYLKRPKEERIAIENEEENNETIDLSVSGQQPTLKPIISEEALKNAKKPWEFGIPGDEISPRYKFGWDK